MLKSISWLQFGSFLLVTGAGYYLYVFGRYYRSEIKSFFIGSGRRYPPVSRERAMPSGGSGAAIEGQPTVRNQDRVREKTTIATRTDHRVGESAVPLSEDGAADDESGDELFSVMGIVIVLLKDVMRQAIADKIGREETLRQLAGVLWKHGELKGSQYQSTINDFLCRSCSSKFALLLGEDELERLWN